MFLKQSKEFIAWWNAQFPLDRWWREKYRVSFGSLEHRKVNPIDIYLEWLEEQLYTEAMNSALEAKEKEEQLAKGILIKERKIDKAEEEKLFEKLRKVNFNNIKVGN